MGIFARLARLIKANINDLISSAEDPEKVLEQIVIDMGKQLIEAKKQVAISIADEKRLAKQLAKEEEQAAEWERRAMLAIRAQDDNLAKDALARKKEHDEAAGQYRDQWRKQKQAVDQLKLALRALNNKIEEAKRKKGVLVARQKRAEAQRKIHETMAGMKSSSAFAAFDEMAAKVDRIEAEAEATAEIAEEASGDTLAHKFAELESSSGADEDLTALKRKMGLLPPEPAPEPKQVRVDASSELAALDPAEQDELAEALAALEAEEQASLRQKR